MNNVLLEIENAIFFPETFFFKSFLKFVLIDVTVCAVLNLLIYVPKTTEILVKSFTIGHHTPEMQFSNLSFGTLNM